MERSFRVIAVFLFAAALYSCNYTRIEDVQLGASFVNSTSGVVLIDTMSVITSTVHLDSIVTSKPSRLLVGGYQNSLTGTVTSSPYFQLNNGSFATLLPIDLVYDSLVVRYLYDGYFIGDTTQMITFTAKRLVPVTGINTNLVFKPNLDGRFYNCDTFKLASPSLGQVKFYPRPTFKQECFFRLSDDYGRFLFNNIINRNDTLSNLSWFKLFLPGLAFISSPNQNQTAVGISQKSLSLRVYYHELINPVYLQNPPYVNFAISTNGNWYNQISYNSSGSLLGNISQPSPPLLTSNEVLSTSTQGITMVQAGSGVYTKIRIPGSQALKGYGQNLVLVSAQIQWTAVPSSYTLTPTNPLPDTLAVYVVDPKNIITRQYASSVGSNIFAHKVVPNLLSLTPYYVLDVTSFFASEIASPVTTGNSLMIGALGSKNGMTLNSFAFVPTNLSGVVYKLSVYCYMDKIYNN